MDSIKTKHYHIWREQDVLIAIAKGTFDEAVIKSYAKDFKIIAEPLTSSRWGHITYLDEWELATPECGYHISMLEHWCKKHKLACDALVYKNDAIKDFVLNNAMKTSKNAAVYQHFESSAKALDWLRSKGFQPTSERLKALKYV